jgi:hypothetical protein
MTGSPDRKRRGVLGCVHSMGGGAEQRVESTGNRVEPGKYCAHVICFTCVSRARR